MSALPFPIVTELGAGHVLMPAKPLFDDLMMVVDTTDREVIVEGLFAVTNGHTYGNFAACHDPDDVDHAYLKRVVPDDGRLTLHPAIKGGGFDAPVGKVEVLGRMLPLYHVEFSDTFPARSIFVHGRFVGLWAGNGE